MSTHFLQSLRNNHPRNQRPPAASDGLRRVGSFGLGSLPEIMAKGALLEHLSQPAWRWLESKGCTGKLLTGSNRRTDRRQKQNALDLFGPLLHLAHAEPSCHEPRTQFKFLSRMKGSSICSRDSPQVSSQEKHCSRIVIRHPIRGDTTSVPHWNSW